MLKGPLAVGKEGLELAERLGRKSVWLQLGLWEGHRKVGERARALLEGMATVEALSLLLEMVEALPPATGWAFRGHKLEELAREELERIARGEGGKAELARVGLYLLNGGEWQIASKPYYAVGALVSLLPLAYAGPLKGLPFTIAIATAWGLAGAVGEMYVESFLLVRKARKWWKKEARAEGL